MKEGNEKKLGIALIVIAIVLAVYAGYTYLHPEEPTEQEHIKKQKDMVTDEAEAVPASPVPISPMPEFEIRNVTQEQLKVLNTDIPELTEMLYEWTRVNGDYVTAYGVEFYGTEAGSITDEKCSFMMRTIVDERYPEESRILMIDYYPDSNRYIIHP